MTLAQKIRLKTLALIFGIVLLGLASIWGLIGMRHENRLAIGEFEELHTVERVGVRLATARGVFNRPGDHHAELERTLLPALKDMKSFVSGHDDDDDDVDADEHDRKEAEHAQAAINKINDLLAQAMDNSAAPNRQSALLDDAMLEVSRVGEVCKTFVHLSHVRARERIQRSIWAMAIIAGLTLAGAASVGLSLIRSIIRPLRRLQESVRRISQGQFSERVSAEGDPEFRELSGEFNHMAEELQDFYLRLEQKVEAKSKDLVRSERLASIGILAAGIAHEIRNPLGVISGYAELSLKRMDSAEPVNGVMAERRVLGVIRDEAFRCKKITDKLLDLTRREDDTRETIELGGIVRDVVFLVKGLDVYRERGATVILQIEEGLNVMADPVQMRQVLLNILVNAVFALPAAGGEIRMDGRRVKDSVELTVTDNGCGMSLETLDHVFEPFYTHKKGAREPGTGLGLSITHAIVERHGGDIRAESDGLGRGSRIIIRLPLAAQASLLSTES